MANEVTLPALGESVTEGIITQWLVEVGDTVDVDQPLVEISTDKVDTEIPSPVAGTVTELRGEVDDTIEVGEVIAVIGGEGESAPAEPASDDADEPEPEPASGSDASSEPAPAPQPPASSSSTPDVSQGEGVLTSPLVRRMLRDAGIAPTDVRATGPGGRITREDAERAIAAGGETTPSSAPDAPAPTEAPAGAGAGDQPVATPPAAGSGPAPVPPPSAPAPASTGVPERPSPGTTHVEFGGDREVTQPISRVRRAIATGMKNSLDTTAQLTAVVEVDMTAVMNLRAAAKDAFKAREGVSLSPLPFIMRAVAMTLPRHPALNSTFDMESGTATYKRYINLGMAVDTERGLLVPNIKDAQDLTVTGMARRIGDLARRTRGKGLSPDDIVGGTFTVTNTGSLGTLLDTPILNPPEVGILGAAAIEKRPVVVSDGLGDTIAIRWMTYLCLSYDHQAVDGADSARFLQDLKWVLEHHDFRGEVGL